MIKKERNYYVLDDILDWLSFDWRFKENNKEYPFNRGKENVVFSWGQILIPRQGIRETVMNRLSDKPGKNPISDINMIYQIPFKVKQKDGTFGSAGIINQDISLSFRHDKEYKYGTITKSIYEVCFYIIEHAMVTNHFYIINEGVFEFMSDCVINNQWGIGSMIINHTPDQIYGDDHAERRKWTVEYAKEEGIPVEDALREAGLLDSEDSECACKEVKKDADTAGCDKGT